MKLTQICCRQHTSSLQHVTVLQQKDVSKAKYRMKGHFQVGPKFETLLRFKQLRRAVPTTVFDFRPNNKMRFSIKVAVDRFIIEHHITADNELS